MSLFQRYVFPCLIALCLSVLSLAPSHAQAQSHYINADDQPAETDNDNDNEDATTAHNVVVTSIQKCYAQLSHDEMLDIETNFVKPYEECKKRLAIKLKKKNRLKAGQQKDTVAKKHKPSKEPDDEAQGQTQDQTDDQPQDGDENGKPPASGGFYRVQKDPFPAGRKPLPDNGIVPDTAPFMPAPAPATAPKTSSPAYNYNR